MLEDSDNEFDDCYSPRCRSRLYELFGLIEKEFESLFAENLALQAKVEALTERLTEGGSLPPEKAAEILEITAADVTASSKKKSGSQVGQKLKTALKVPPGRLVSSFKAGVGVGQDASRARYVKTFQGHRDGVWHGDVSKTPGRVVLGTASADQTARIWCMETAHCALQYTGHTGSVNSISFNPKSATLSDLLVVTASGDQSAHVWKAHNLVAGLTMGPGGPQGGQQQPHHHSSEDELDPLSEKEEVEEENAQLNTVRTPQMQLTGHTGVVICAEWLCGGDQVITASWDRTANIYDAEKGEILNILSGHDQELTHCHAHPSRKLVVTSSKDTTFRLWDFREPIHSVAVFQGHAESVTSTVFSSSDKIVSGSDDRTVKIWDLKNMRSPLAAVRLDSPVNRLAISRHQQVIAIPHDNRHVRLYDLHGVRLARLPRHNTRCHRRMVCCAAWADDNPGMNLFTCGFDKQVLGWKITVPPVF